MTPEQRQSVRAILESALALDPARRPSFLDEACPDPLLRQELESLVAAHEQAGTEALEPGFPGELPLDEEARFRLAPGRQIGAYEILEEIAVGGMGRVYRAARADGQYRQQVALKIVRSGLGAESTAARFRDERQILASLDHPNIAKLLDGGATADGLPYFVMELIDGLPITEYCHKHELSIEARLQTFRTVCSAVHCAHQHLVIHRDIKPSNILVTSSGTAKLLDFGIAKILDPSLAKERARLTLTGLWVMTPEYASPEQLRGDAITTATDVYSLGLVLYELLTGHRPYRFPSHLPHEIARVVLETDPERPSVAVVRNDTSRRKGTDVPFPTPGFSGGLRGYSPERLRQRLSGDLDNIVLKAIGKERHERYGSADQLSEDVRRYLEGLPVLARRSTLAYRGRKYLLRHKIGVATAVLVLLSLLTGIALTNREARIARANAFRAERRFNDVRDLARSLIFDVHDSIRDLPGSTPTRKLIVDRALEYLNSLASESQGDLSLQRELADAYERLGLVQGQYLQSSLGDTQGSLNSYEKALAIRQRVAGQSSEWNDKLSLARSQRLVARQLWATGDRRGANGRIEAATATSEALNSIHPNEVKVLKELASDYEVSASIGDLGRPGDASRVEATYRKAVSVDEKLVPMQPDDIELQYGYAIDLSHVGEMVANTDGNAALPYHRKELEIMQALHRRSPDIRFARGVARANGEIAAIYGAAGDDRQALEYELRDLAIYQELIRVDPTNNLLQRGVAIEYGNAATRLGATGNTPLSLAYMQKSLEIMRGVVAAHPENIGQRDTLGQMYSASGANLMRARKPEAALKAYQEALALYNSFHEADPEDLHALIKAATCTEKSGEAAALGGREQEAEDYFRGALGVVEPLLSTPSPDVNALYTAADAYFGLGELKVREGRAARARTGGQRAGWMEARSWYLKSMEVWSRIPHPSRVSPDGFEVGNRAQVQKRLQQCEAALAGAN